MANPDSVMVAHTPMDPYSYQDSLDTQIEKYINIVNFHRKSSSKNKAMLSFKYDELTLKVTVIQILIILFSTAISFIEALKNHYSLNEKIFNVVIVTLSTSVALIMAIYRFLKYEEKKENVKNAIQDHTFIINKFRKIYSQIESVKEKPDYIERFNKIVDNFENETFDNYISIRENFDTIFSFRDSIYYKNKYKKNLLKLEKANNEIEMIDDYKRDDIKMKEASLLEKIFCCRTHIIDYDAFIESGKTKRNAENEERKKKKEEREKREKEKREKLLEIQNRTENTDLLVKKNEILEEQFARLQNEFNDLQRKQKDDMQENMYNRAVVRTASPTPVHQRNVQQPNVHFEDIEPLTDNDSNETQIYYYDDKSDMVSPPIFNQDVDPKTKADYELHIDQLKQELERLVNELNQTTSTNLSEINILRSKINNMDAERVRSERYRENMEAEIIEMRKRHQDVYDRCSDAPVLSDETQALKRIIDNCQKEMAKKEAEIAALTCHLRGFEEKIVRQEQERDESERKHRRDIAVIVDDFNHLEDKYKTLQTRIADTEETVCIKNKLIKELTYKLEENEKNEKNEVFEKNEKNEENEENVKKEKNEENEEKEKNEVFEEKEKNEEKENLLIMINEIDTDSELGSKSSSPDTIV